MNATRFLAVVLMIGGFSEGRAQSPQFCGDQGTDNRPNWCQIKKDGTWVQTKSTCEKISDTTYLYTSCGGVQSRQTGTDQCCKESPDCPGAYYVQTCVGH